MEMFIYARSMLLAAEQHWWEDCYSYYVALFQNESFTEEG
jgi:hypothetical protein